MANVGEAASDRRRPHLLFGVRVSVCVCVEAKEPKECFFLIIQPVSLALQGLVNWEALLRPEAWAILYILNITMQFQLLCF